MNTAKEALLAAGRIKEVGRGRISNENHTWLLAQVAAGVTFSDYPKTGAKVVVLEATPDAPAQTVYVKPAATSTDKVIADLFYRYDESEWQARAEDGTIFGMREVCQKCGLSLVGHRCDSPIVLGKRVEVVPRR